jgi:ribosomal-protein-alanine N-acetyltransferase
MSGGEYPVRPFRREDLDAVVKINLRCLPENYNPSFYLDLFTKFPATFIVAEAQGQVVGYVMCRIERGFSELTRFRLVRKGHVVSLAVVIPYYYKDGETAYVMAVDLATWDDARSEKWGSALGE